MNSSGAIDRVSRADGYDVNAIVQGIRCNTKRHLATALQLLVNPSARAVERTNTSDGAIRVSFSRVHAIS